jgi:hypothetical protein
VSYPSFHLTWYLASLDDFLSQLNYCTRATAVTRKEYYRRLLQGLTVIGFQTVARNGSFKNQQGEGKLEGSRQDHFVFSVQANEELRSLVPVVDSLGMTKTQLLEEG